MKRCSLPEGSVIFSIKLPNIMQMQETLTGSTFDHPFSFYGNLTLSLLNSQGIIKKNHLST